MRQFFLILICLLGCLTWVAPAQTYRPVAVFTLADGSVLPSDGDVTSRTSPVLLAPVSLPRMAPELALQSYQDRAARQNADLTAYSATTLIHAELPDTAQKGDYELQRQYTAPRLLQFKPVHYNGDGFVKNNVITRLLQSEVDHVQKDDGSLTALTAANYKFSHKGTTLLEARLVHVYQVKPRKKRPGLFKGRIYLDAFTGSLVRSEGTIVKSTSFFVRKVDFVQDYADIGSFTFPVHVHSEARARILGRAIVDIYHFNYQPVASNVQSAHLISLR